MARAEALRILAEKVRGADPASVKKATRQARTVSELCDLYWADAEKGNLLTRRRTPKKASTLLSDKGRIERHIKPLIGQLRAAAVTASDIELFMQDVAEGKTAARAKTANRRGLSNVRGGRGVASRTIGLLGAIFSYAVRKGLRSDNPARGVARPADGRRTRRMNNDEYRILGLALRAAAKCNVWPPAIAVVKFLACSGWRTGEALALRWVEIDFSRRTASLTESKTGRSVRPLSQSACDVLSSMKSGGELVFPASRGDGQMTGFRSFWKRIARFGGLPPDITPHVLRHSFASLASDLGYSEATISALIGHSNHTITGRYIHSADSVLLAAADAVAQQTADLMGEFTTTEAARIRSEEATPQLKDQSWPRLTGTQR
jgi:integrase